MAVLLVNSLYALILARAIKQEFSDILIVDPSVLSTRNIERKQIENRFLRSCLDVTNIKYTQVNSSQQLRDYLSQSTEDFLITDFSNLSKLRRFMEGVKSDLLERVSIVECSADFFLVINSSFSSNINPFYRRLKKSWDRGITDYPITKLFLPELPLPYTPQIDPEVLPIPHSSVIEQFRATFNHDVVLKEFPNLFINLKEVLILGPYLINGGAFLRHISDILKNRFPKNVAVLVKPHPNMQNTETFVSKLESLMGYKTINSYFNLKSDSLRPLPLELFFGLFPSWNYIGAPSSALHLFSPERVLLVKARSSNRYHDYLERLTYNTFLTYWSGGKKIHYA